MRRRVLGGVFCAALFILAVTATAQRGTKGDQWPNHSGDKGSTKYAPLDQITKSNVKNLRIVWRRPAVANEFRTQHPNIRFSNLFRSTPLMIDGVLYASNGLGLLEAFDAATGKTLWVQELLEQGAEALSGTSTRGVAYWRSGGDERILAVRPPYLIAINVRTGELIRSFGDSGKIDLRTELGPQPQPFNFTSAPLIVKDVAIIGSSIADNPNVKQGTPGSVRGYDVKTGKLRWTFKSIPREGEFGVETWQNRSWEYTGAVNAWSNLSADEELGYVYLPLTSPTSDMYGGHRLGNNLFSDSLVCLKADTGERVWHFQMVHHDLWAAFDPETKILYVPSVTGTFAADLLAGDSNNGNLRYIHGTREFVAGPRGLSLFKPPYGRITAINLNTGDHVWMKPNGDGPRDHPSIKHLNLPPLGQPGRASPLVTKTLLFVGEGDPINVRTPPGGGGKKFRAYDKASGAVLWETEFSAGTTGAPMTYLYKGKQYIVVAIGSTEHPSEFLALALP